MGLSTSRSDTKIEKIILFHVNSCGYCVRCSFLLVWHITGVISSHEIGCFHFKDLQGKISRQRGFAEPWANVGKILWISSLAPTATSQNKKKHITSFPPKSRSSGEQKNLLQKLGGGGEKNSLHQSKKTLLLFDSHLDSFRWPSPMKSLAQERPRWRKLDVPWR